MAIFGQNIGPCECCGSSSSTTTFTSTTGTTGTTTTGTTPTFTTDTTDTSTTGTTGTATGTTDIDCCCFWANKADSHPITVTLSNPASCDCGGSGSGTLQGDGGGACTFTGEVELCSDEPNSTKIMTLTLTVACNAGVWNLHWSLFSDMGDDECAEEGDIDAYVTDCDSASFRVCWGPIGGIPSEQCCDGGTGSGSWDICFESS